MASQDVCIPNDAHSISNVQPLYSPETKNTTNVVPQKISSRVNALNFLSALMLESLQEASSEPMAKAAPFRNNLVKQELGSEGDFATQMRFLDWCTPGRRFNFIPPNVKAGGEYGNGITGIPDELTTAQYKRRKHSENWSL